MLRPPDGDLHSKSAWKTTAILSLLFASAVIAIEIETASRHDVALNQQNASPANRSSGEM